ncbi:MAG: helix-turn-helix domain-containing protein [Candidatus Algichlamydia australiensis]|nr:helix-turn-helix domain-containing protein [Chlamydiales bacterium]
MSEFFKGIKQGLEEAVEFEEKKRTLRTKKIEIPKPPKKYKAKDIKRIRAKENYSQAIFAKVLNVSVKTIQAWESGERTPSQVAMRLLQIIDDGIYTPEVFKEAC